MKKKISIVIAILMANVVISQTQFSLYSGVSLSNVNSEDFSDSRAIGLGIGISSATLLTQKSDLIVEFGYEYKSFSTSNYYNFESNAININDPIGINNITITSLYNYFILTPEDNNFYLTAQAGLGTTVYNSWSSDNPDLSSALEGAEHFKPFYILGGSVGFENLRIALRYNKSFGNMLSGAYTQGPTNNNSAATNDRELNASISYFSINLTYLFNSQM
jgi:hypothetical protein